MKTASDACAHWTRSIAAALVAIAAVAGPTVAISADRGRLPDVVTVPFGQPVWEQTDFPRFAAPVGTAITGYSEFFETMASLLPPPEHVLHPSLGIGPGAPHGPPYDYELGESVKRLQLREASNYTAAEFSHGMGVWVAWMNVPAPGEVGASPDDPQGRVIPNHLFPIRVTGTSYRNGWRHSVLADFEVPPLFGGINVRPMRIDGHSHFPVFVADSANYGPPGTPVTGIYRYVITMLDTSGHGWLVHTSFTIMR